MLALAIRGLSARKLRTFLTTLAVTLGVTLMVGTFVLTDTINSSFGAIFKTANEGVDISVTPNDPFKNDHAEPEPMTGNTLTKVERADGVAQAAGGIFAEVKIFGPDGKRLTTSGAPNFVTSLPPEPFNPYKFTEGRAPTGPGEMAIDQLSADKKSFKLGDRIKVAGETEARAYKLVGVAKFGDVSSFGGASTAILALAEAQRITGRPGKYDSIAVEVAKGQSVADVLPRIRAGLPRTLEVRTGEENAKQQTKRIEEGTSFLTTALLVFSFVALFVGGFIILNTFSITVQQRTREFGLLRTLGASRRQILRSVVLEALAIGVAASALGLLAGVGAAEGLNALFKAVGIDLPKSGTELRSRTVLVSLLVGVVLTVLASLSPALRATRVSPMAALSEAAIPVPRRRRRVIRALLQWLLLAGGIALASVGLFATDDSDTALPLLGAGAVLVFVAVALVSPALVRPIASIVGRPLEALRGLTGRLARENSVRNPGRTAVTASALMVGLALVVFVSIFAAGINASVDATIDKSFAGDLTLQNDDGFTDIPAAAGRLVAGVPGVETVSSVRRASSRVDGVKGHPDVSGIDPATFAKVFKIDWKDGSDATAASFARGGAAADESWAKKNNVKVGEVLTVATPTRRKTKLKVEGTYKDQAGFSGELLTSNAILQRDFGAEQDQLALVGLRAGADATQVQRAIDGRLKAGFPSVKSLDQSQFKKDQHDKLSQVLALIYALLALAVIVSLFGIVNTLALSISERTRELGMLRAIGMSRKQVKSTIRYEAVITALIGAALGLVLGLFFAVLISRPLADEGFSLSIPVVTLLILMVVAGLAGVLAAIPPARKAAKLDVLEALAYE